MFHVISGSAIPLSHGSRTPADEPDVDSPEPSDITAEIRTLSIKRGVSFDGIPLPYQVTRWARLAERLCIASRGFLVFPGSSGLILNSSGPLSPVQWHNARIIAGEVIRHHQITTLANGKPWTPTRRPVFQIEIAVPAIAAGDQLRAVLGVVDLTSARHEEHLVTLQALARAYNYVSDLARPV